jgi:hypothetical protein
METMKNAGAIRSILSQPKNNTTTWIGHLQNETIDHFSGQTFKCPEDGYLDNIQVYATVVQRSGEVLLTLHEFNDGRKTWDSSVAASTLFVSGKDEGQWLTFNLNSAALEKEKLYGFRLQSNEAMLGIGELARGNDEPCTFGQEWNADSENRSGVFFSWFSLAFKVQMVA